MKPLYLLVLSLILSFQLNADETDWIFVNPFKGITIHKGEAKTFWLTGEEALYPLQVSLSDNSIASLDTLNKRVTGINTGIAMLNAVDLNQSNHYGYILVSVLPEHIDGVWSVPTLNLYDASTIKSFQIPVVLPDHGDFERIVDISLHVRIPSGVELFSPEPEAGPILTGTSYTIMTPMGWDVEMESDYPNNVVYHIKNQNITRARFNKGMCHACSIELKADTDFEPGLRSIECWGSYTTDNGYALTTYNIGSVDDCKDLIKLRFIDGEKGDISNDGTIDINDLNALVNVLLGKDEPSLRCHLTGGDDIDIDDVNAVVNRILRK